VVGGHDCHVLVRRGEKGLFVTTYCLASGTVVDHPISGEVALAVLGTPSQSAPRKREYEALIDAVVLGEGGESATHRQAELIKAEGNALFAEKKTQEALRSFDRAVELSPHHLIYRLNRAAALLELGQGQEVRVWWLSRRGGGRLMGARC
jgi:hypothetical protein